MLHKVCIKSQKIQGFGLTSDSPCCLHGLGAETSPKENVEVSVNLKAQLELRVARAHLCHQLAPCDLERSQLSSSVPGITPTFPTQPSDFSQSLCKLGIKAHPNYRCNQGKHALLLSDRAADTGNCLGLGGDQNTLPVSGDTTKAGKSNIWSFQMLLMSASIGCRGSARVCCEH